MGAGAMVNGDPSSIAVVAWAAYDQVRQLVIIYISKGYRAAGIGAGHVDLKG